MTDTQTPAPTLTLRRTFNAPRERVFAAFTDASFIRRWFGPPGVVVGDVTFDARVEGRYRIVMTSSSGEDFVVSGVISTFEPPALLAYTFRWTEDEPELERDTFVRIEFFARGAQTDIIFTQQNFTDFDSRDRHDAGWSGAFEKLDAALPAPLRIEGIDLGAYMVRDTRRAIAWYRDVFGLEPTLRYPGERGAEYDLPDGSTFGLFGGGESVIPFQPGNGLLFAIADLDAATSALAARGIVAHYQTEMPTCRLAMVTDSEGNTVTLHERKAR